MITYQEGIPTNSHTVYIKLMLVIIHSFITPSKAASKNTCTQAHTHTTYKTLQY